MSSKMSNKELAVDNGRIRMRALDGVLYCEAYMNDEFKVSDVQAMIDCIKKHFFGKCDIILKKIGSYSVSVEAQIFLSKGVREFGNFVYVVDSDVKYESAEYAAHTYMKAYNTKVARSIELAQKMLIDARNS